MSLFSAKHIFSVYLSALIKNSLTASPTVIRGLSLLFTANATTAIIAAFSKFITTTSTAIAGENCNVHPPGAFSLKQYATRRFPGAHRSASARTDAISSVQNRPPADIPEHIQSKLSGILVPPNGA